MLRTVSFAVALLASTSAFAAPVLDAGWTYDQIDDEFTDSTGSPYEFTLDTAGYFRLTDQFNVGDTFYVYDSGNLIGTSSLNGAQTSLDPIGDPLGDLGWTSADYQHLEIFLAAGSYSLTVQGDGIGGVPAGFYVRLDSAEVPEPAALALFGLGLLGLGASRRRR